MTSNLVSEYISEAFIINFIFSCIICPYVTASLKIGTPPTTPKLYILIQLFKLLKNRFGNFIFVYWKPGFVLKKLKQYKKSYTGFSSLVSDLLQLMGQEGEMFY